MIEEIHGDTDIAIGIGEGGKVVMSWHRQCNRIDFDPQNAFEIAEGLARTAHKARFGENAPDDTSYLAQQIKSRLTEQMRDKMVQRVAIMLTSMIRQEKSHGYMALQIVDTVFAEVE